MKCLSLWNPWALLLVTGHKRVETRAWATKYRGPLLIHASKHWDDDQADLCFDEPFATALRSVGALEDVPVAPETAVPLTGDVGRHLRLTFTRGAIIGRVEVVECYPTEAIDFDHSGLEVTPLDPVWQYAPGKLRLWHEEKAFGDYSPGRFGFLCTNPVRFARSIPYRGCMGLFDVSDALVAEATA